MHFYKPKSLAALSKNKIEKKAWQPFQKKKNLAAL
jgi:hypothetical protein